MFFYQNVCQSNFMRQQPVAVIFLPVIELIKIYRLQHLTILALEKSVALLIKTQFFLPFTLYTQGVGTICPQNGPK